MAGPQDWGAEPAPADDGPAAWGAQPAESDEPRDDLSGLLGMVAAPIMPEFTLRVASTAAGRAGLYDAAIKPWFDLLGSVKKAVTGAATPDEETDLAGSMALNFLGGGADFAKAIPEVAKAAAPVAKAFTDTILTPSAVRLDAYARTGDPNGVRLEPPAPEVKPAPIRPIEGSPFGNIPRSVAARTGVPEVDAVLDSPVTKSVIDNTVIDRSHDVPYMAGASKELNDPTVFIDKHVPAEQKVGGVTFDPAEPWAIHEHVEQHTMDILTKGGMDDQAAYKVAHFNFAEPAEQAWYRAHGIDQEAAEAQQAKWLPKIQGENTGEAPLAPGNVRLYRAEGPLKPELAHDSNVRGLHFTTNKQHAETFTKPLFGKDRQLYFVDVPRSEFEKLPVDPNGITIVTPKMAARKTKMSTSEVPQSLYKKPYPNGAVPNVDHESLIEPPPTPEESARGAQIVRDWAAKQTTSAVPMLQEARSLGVIGMDAPEHIDLAALAERDKDTPAEEAIRAVPPQTLGAARTPKEMLGEMPVRGGQEAYEQRAREWVGKIDAPDDVRDAIGRIAEEENFFPAAREGELPASHVAAAAEAAGLDPKDIDRAGLATRFDNDAKVRAVIQALRHTTRDFLEASEKARREPSEENAAALTEAQERQRYVQEYTLGFRGEAGRTLNTWKELLRETERARATTKLKADEETGAAPKGVSDLIDAAADVRSNLGKPNGKIGLQKLIDAAERLVNAPPRAPGEKAPPLPPELKSLVDEARDTLGKLKGDKTPAAFQKLIDAAERQVTNLVRNKSVRNPTEALPPEWQALVDKADLVTKRFGGIAKGEQAAMLLARMGKTAAEQAELARSVQGLTENQVARVLARLRNEKRPGWFFWSVQQGLISGLITHTKYAIVNAGQSVLDRVVAPELAAVGSRLRGSDASLIAPLHALPAMIRAVPDAFAGTVQAFKTGMRVPLESELRLAERGERNPEAAGAQVPYGTPQGPNWGIWKKVFNEQQLAKAERVIGVPGRSANSIHTFFKILNENGAASLRAYEAAAKEKPGAAFWDRYQHHLDNPTDEALRSNVEDAYSGTFMEKLGDQSEKFAKLVRNSPAKWLIFFTHIPLNMIRRSVEYSPLALVNLLGETRMGSAIKGELGPEAQNLAFAKMAIGTSVGAYFIDKALSGKATGDYPTDPKERRRWQDLGIQPNSIQADGRWVSLERLGPPALVARIAANYAAVIQHYDGHDDDALMKASLSLVLGTANALASDVGFETVKNIVDVLENPRDAARFAAWQLSSYAMPVSAVTQFASAMDPDMRRADTLLSGLKYHIPVLRETLLPKRDPLYGEPVPNPGYHGILRSSPINTDPVKRELDRIGYYPAAPQRTIGGVRLNDAQYDRYEATAGPFVKASLSAAMRSPAYQRLPVAQQQAMVKGIISYNRAKARAALQMDRPHLIQQGIDQRKAAILGR